MAKKPRQTRVWHITEVRKRGYYVGSVEPATADAAIKRAIEEFGIDNRAPQNRLIAQRQA